MMVKLKTKTVLGLSIAIILVLLSFVFYLYQPGVILNLFARDNCKSLRYSGTRDNRINIVFVPSGFHGDMKSFEWKVKTMWKDFESYTPFNPAITELNAFYVPRENWPTNNFCYRINPLSPQFVFCRPAIAKTLSRDCLKGLHETVVVVNDGTMGGGGFFTPVNLHVASVTVKPGNSYISNSSQIAVHELSHILFGFGDEYNEKQNTYSKDNVPNCDVAGCPKWKDLMGVFKDVACQKGGCTDGNYYTGGKSSIMSDNYGPFTSNQERNACCLYKARTGNFPGSLCAKFAVKVVSPLNDYCNQNQPDKSLLTEDYSAKSLNGAQLTF